MSDKWVEAGIAVCVVILTIVGLAILMGLPTMWLWNGCLVDAVPVTKPIGFWQAVGLNFLFGMLFKSHTTSKSK